MAMMEQSYQESKGRLTGLFPSDLDPMRFISSTLGLSVFANAILYPLYFCKTRIQTNVGKLSGNPAKDVWLEGSRTVRSNGIRGLYRGFTFSTLTIMPAILAHISIYVTTRNNLGVSTNSDQIRETSMAHNTAASMLSGMLAESVAVLFWVPEEVIQQRIVLAPEGHGLRDVVRTIYDESDRRFFRAFFRGTRAAYAQYLPSSGIWWASLESLKYLTADVDRSPLQSALRYTVCGAGAGIITGILMNPMDIIRTRIQTNQGTYGKTSIAGVMSEIIRNEGMYAGLSKGVAAKVGLLTIEGVLLADLYQTILAFSKKDTSY